MLAKIEVCPRCSGQISNSGSIFGFSGYTEICCIHCGWAEYIYEEDKSKRPREYFDRQIVPYDEALISEKKKDRPKYGYPDIEVYTDFTVFNSGFERIVISSRCPFCDRDKKTYKSKKTRRLNLLRSVCEKKHVWYFNVKDKEPISWR
jgi:hypothetical protein|tara:strand:+ start:296 stop:739 length:444 start_codon:yes stop_codon:yes gene_type:complete